MSIDIDVFGKPGCDVCDRFKKRLDDMGCTYKSLNIDEYTQYSDDWRERKSYEILAALDMNDGIYPIARINGIFYSYAKAIKKIKELVDEQRSKS